jgi:hypothetical protein
MAAPGLLLAQIPDSAFTWASSSDTVFFLRSSFPLDWSAIGRSARPDFQPSNPDTSLIRDSYDDVHGVSVLDFKARLPASLPRGHYWILANSGATEVYPRGLTGSIVISTDPAGWPLTRVDYQGSLEAARRSGDHLGEPNFGMFSRDSIRVRSTLASVSGTRARPTIRALLGSHRIEATLDSPTVRPPRTEGMPSRARAFEIPETGQVFLSIRWPDDDTCYGSYALYDVTKGIPRFVAENPGACGE